uniref:DUF2007 domain-containing protein n=1 Tax=viral metagenome TaxID=1070528 RepID=A0A6M3ILU3_9ZZZZ
MRIIVRHAEDDFIAMKTAQGMENSGANVFSITNNGQATHFGATAPHTRFCIWAKIENDGMIESIDDAIEKELDE